MCATFKTNICPLNRLTYRAEGGGEARRGCGSGGVESNKIDFEDNNLYCMKVVLGGRHGTKNVIK